MCEREGHLTPATCVDRVTPPAGERRTNTLALGRSFPMSAPRARGDARGYRCLPYHTVSYPLYPWKRVSRIYLRPLWKIQVCPIAASIRAQAIPVGAAGLRATSGAPTRKNTHPTTT